MKDATDASQLHFLCWERCKVLVRRRDSVFVDSQNLCVRTLHQLTVQGIVDELRKEEYRDEVNAMDPHVHIRGISIGKDIMSQIERKLSLVLEVFQAMDALDDSYQ